MKRSAAFAVTCLTVIAGTLAVLWLTYHQADERRSLLLSALVAFALQLMAFAVAYSLARQNVIAGWGAGALMRLAGLSVYALIVVPQLGLPLAAALISMALFLFLSTLLEPFFLRP